METREETISFKRSVGERYTLICSVARRYLFPGDRDLLTTLNRKRSKAPDKFTQIVITTTYDEKSLAISINPPNYTKD